MSSKDENIRCNIKMKDKYGNDYVALVDFDTEQMLPVDYRNTHPTMDFSITLLHEDKVIEKYHTNASSSLLIGSDNKERYKKELDIERRINRHGDRLNGKNLVEIKINYRSHFNNMMQSLVDDFTKQFDNLTVEQKKDLLNSAMDDIEAEDRSIIGLMGKVFENCTQIDDFLALDSTGALRQLMQENIKKAYTNGKFNIDNLISNENKEDYDIDR